MKKFVYVVGINKGDDYQWEVLPGIEKACEDFLKDKPEKVIITNRYHQGVIIKK